MTFYEFYGRIHRDPEEIATWWGNYFRELYSDTERSHFDPLFKSIIDIRVDNILQELSNIPDANSVTFTADYVKERYEA